MNLNLSNAIKVVLAILFFLCLVDMPYGGLALLFQPFYKVALGRQMWNTVDVIVGLGLIISIFLKPKSQDK